MSYGTVQAEKMTTESGYSLGAGNASSFKNRIINGGMTIDQRNAGATSTELSYTVDRWQYDATQNTKFTWGQNYGGASLPAGFINYLGFKTTTAYSVVSTDTFYVRQLIEGLNMADLGWGSANARPITLSFWVQSSLTGTFGGALQNFGGNRAYPFSFTISAANTWEQKTVTIAGDTTGTWLTTNGTGMRVVFSLGAGSNYTGTANAWVASNLNGVTGQQQVVGTLNATFYITGVQLEVGTVATSFDFRSFGTELALCQRYCTVFGTPSLNQYVHLGTGSMYTGTAVNISIALPVSMRSTPTISKTVNGSSVWLQVYVGSTGYNTNSTPEVGEYLSVGSNAMRVYCPSSFTGGTAGQAAWCQVMNGAQFVFSSEL
jgi:hypothetical protein